MSQSLAAPSANTQSFDATIEVNGSAGVLGKSNLLLQGHACLVFSSCFRCPFLIASAAEGFYVASHPHQALIYANAAT